ncbi:MAG: PHP domain-containing protein [Patescibacteria group bacterium]
MSAINYQKPQLRNTRENNQNMVDFHVHSNYSLDGTIPIAKLLKTAKRLNLGLAICDHNEIQGSLEAGQQSDVIIIPGIEVNCNNGTHVLLYFRTHSELESFFENIVKPNKKSGAFVIDLLPQELIEKARSFNCVISMPHPFDVFKGGVQRAISAGTVKESFIRDNVDAIEVLNGMANREQNKQSADWARQMKKPILAGSDGHVLWQIGTVATKVFGKNAEEIISNLLGENDVFGEELTGWKKRFTEIRKEMHLIFRKEGIKILSNQIKRSIKKR